MTGLQSSFDEGQPMRDGLAIGRRVLVEELRDLSNADTNAVQSGDREEIIVGAERFTSVAPLTR